MEKKKKMKEKNLIFLVKIFDNWKVFDAKNSNINKKYKF
jgi:hypothetical protein